MSQGLPKSSLSLGHTVGKLSPKISMSHEFLIFIICIEHAEKPEASLQCGFSNQISSQVQVKYLFICFITIFGHYKPQKKPYIGENIVIHLFYQMFKKESREMAEWSHGNMLKTERRGCHCLPNWEISSELFRMSVASRRQTIIFSSDDSRSLHIIVCYYRGGPNRCWAIRFQYGGKGRPNGLRSRICDCGSRHVHLCDNVLFKKIIYIAAISTVYGRHTGKLTDIITWSLLR